MAAVTHRVSTASTLNVTSYASGAFTPAVGDLLLVWVSAAATVAAGSLTGTGAGLTFTKVTSRAHVSGLSTAYLFIADALVTAAASQTVTFDCTGDAATGCVIQVASVSAMVRAGTGAVKQSSGQDNQALGTTPAPVFGASCLTANPTLGLVFNETNPATMTPPASWTEQNDTGFATPAKGAEYVSRNSGFTGTTITWGGTSASAFCSIAVELDTTAPVGVSTEADTAVGQSVALGASASTETDTALARAVAVAPGIATQADSAVSVGIAVGIGRSEESDTALALSFTQGAAAVEASGTGSSGGQRVVQLRFLRVPWAPLEERLAKIERELREAQRPKRKVARKRGLARLRLPDAPRAAHAYGYVTGALGVALGEATNLGLARASALVTPPLGVARGIVLRGAVARGSITAAPTIALASATNYGALLIEPRRQIVELQEEVEALTLLIARLRLDDVA